MTIKYTDADKIASMAALLLSGLEDGHQINNSQQIQFSSALRKFIGDNDLTQTQFAELCGISAGTISGILNNRHKISRNFLKTLQFVIEQNKKNDAKFRFAAMLEASESELISLKQALEAVVPRTEHAESSTNAAPIPLNTRDYDLLVAVVDAAISYHDVDRWNRRVVRLIRSITEIMSELETLGKQSNKTLTAWVPVQKLLKSVVKSLRALLKSMDEDS